MDVLLQIHRTHTFHYPRADFAVAAFDSEDGSLASAARSSVLALAGVLVLFESADEGFIAFNRSEKLTVVLLHCFAQAVIHEPSGFLSDADMLRELHGGNALARSGQKVDRDEPFFESHLALAENRSGLDREVLLALRAAVTLAAAESINRRVSAVRAILAVAETDARESSAASFFIAEVFHEFCQCFE